MYEFGDFCGWYYDVRGQLVENLSKRAEFYFNIEKLEKEAFRNTSDFEARRKRIKKDFLNAIGKFPEKTPLKPVITGTLERQGYTIEKVIYQSRPDFYVTSLLYIPKKCDKKCPAVLFPCGHSEEAKANPGYQKVCIDLVNNGFMVLAVDPIGQGERKQYYDPKSGKCDVAWGTTEHNYAGLPCSLAGFSLAKHFIWDLVRGLDYLCARPEADKNRIGITGNSGGGTQTSYMMLVDDRLKCAIPCTFINSRKEYMKSGGVHDFEQTIPGAVSFGLNHDDFLTAIAPNPVQIGAVAYDFFPIEGTFESYEKAKKVYELYGAKKKLNIAVDNSTHAYTAKLREASVNWFKLHLKNEAPDFVTEQNLEAEDPKLLLCMPEGSVYDRYPRSKRVYEINAAEFEAIRPKRTPIKTEKDLERHAESVSARLNELLSISVTEDRIFPRIMASERNDHFKYESLFFFTEEGIACTAHLIMPLEIIPGKTYITLFENGTDEVNDRMPLIKSLINKGYSLFIFDPRGTGGVKARPTFPEGNEIFNMEYRLASEAMMLGKSMASFRVFDILRAHQYLCSRPDILRDNISLIAYGRSAPLALMSACLEPRFKTVILSDMLYSYESVINARLYKYDNRMVINGIAQKLDIADMTAALAGRDLRLVNLLDENQDLLPKDNTFLKLMRLSFPAALKTCNISFHQNSDVRKII